MTNTDMSLRDAAQAVIDRWETPLWKDAPATAVFIADLRNALARDAGRASMQFPGFSAADMATASAQGFRDGVASVAASAGSEPVAHLWQHSETGRTRVLMPDMVVDACATWLLVGPLYLHPSPPEGMVAEQALRKVLSVVQRYLPPDGPTAHDAMTEIIAIVDPWPLGPLEKP